MPQQFCKIQSFLLERRVSYWEVSCIIITKRHLINNAREISVDGLLGAGQGATLPLLWGRPFIGVNSTEELMANSPAIGNCFNGHFISI